MGLNYDDKSNIFSIDIVGLTEDRILESGLNLISISEGHYLVEYKKQEYDINTIDNVILHRKSYDLLCGTLYYGYSYLFELKRILQ